KATLLGWAFAFGALLHLPTAQVAVADSGFELGALRPGVRIEGRGKQQGDRFSSSRVTLKPDSGRDIEIKAPIDSQSAPNSASIRLLGRPVTIAPAAKVDGSASLPELLAVTAPGSWVKVRGRDRGEWITAEAISLRQELEGSAEIE